MKPALRGRNRAGRFYAISSLLFGYGAQPSYTDTGLAAETLHSYRVRARDKSPAQNVTGWSAAASATTAPTPNNYDTWLAVHEIAPGEQEFDDDPDDDGYGNGIEAWFGTNPLLPSDGMVGLTTDGLTSTFSHPQNLAPPTDVGLTYEWSVDCSQWHTSGPGSGITVTNDGTTTITTTASVALEQLFLRVGAIRN